MLEYINQHAHNIKETIIFSNTHTIKSILEFDISSGDLRQHPIPVNFFSCASELFFDDTQILNLSDFQNSLSFHPDMDDIINFQCTREFSFDEEILLYSTEGLLQLIQKFLELNIDSLSDIKNKLILKTFITDSQHFLNHSKSSLFLINSSLNDNLFNKETLNFIEKYNNTNAIIGLIPDSLDEDSLKEISLLPFIKSLLSFISNERKKNKFYFKGKFNLTINAIKYNDKEKIFCHFKSLKLIFEYLNSSPATKDQRKTFIRKTICDKLTKDEEISLNDLPPEFFDKIYKDASFLFDTFHDNEVSIFLKEKKEVLKEYLALSKDINTNINNNINDLIKGLITILTFLITNVILFSKSVVSTNTFIIVMFSCSILIIFFLVIHVTIKYSEIEIINEKQKLFRKHFSFLPSKSDSIKEDLENMIDQEILRFDNILGYITIIYMCLLLIVLSLILFIK